MATKKNSKLKATFDWKEDLLSAGKSVAITVKKLNFYRDARRTPPDSISQLLQQQELNLDVNVKKLLTERENLKYDVLSDDRFNDDILREIEFSYQKAVCFYNGKRRTHSRMFFLPCIYWSKKNGETNGIIEFKGPKAETFANYVAAFLEEHFCESQVTSPHVTVFKETLKDWNIPEEEEKMLPFLHQAILSGKSINVTQTFPSRKSSIRDDSEGWSVAVLPFSVEHDDEAWLESISFEGYDEEFLEGFEEIFDPSSKLDYQVPCDPTNMQDESVRHLWGKQLDLTIKEMITTKKNKQIGIIETTFIWDSGEFIGVVMDFKILEPQKQNDLDDHNDGIVFHRQISRQVLLDENPGDLSAYLVEYPSLMREDFDLIFGHQNKLSD